MSQTNGTVRIYGKKDGSVEAKPKHGRVGWREGKKVFFFQGLGWVSEEALLEAKTKSFPTGTVFISHHSFLLAPEVHEMKGYRSVGPKLRRTPVYFHASLGDWVSLSTFGDPRVMEHITATYGCPELGAD